ncbi:hypothetical protein E2C01_093323 [Portunus trituberculatus]|uniref:Uncharacterized protein n=1 Tax=Portunus trituberculatus TaxID=210409 RepID=A0A5B7JUH7_PORTR|nr:hypothetical protein [Portunus trituberculatus]
MQHNVWWGGGARTRTGSHTSFALTARFGSVKSGLAVYKEMAERGVKYLSVIGLTAFRSSFGDVTCLVPSQPEGEVVTRW